MLDKDGEGNPGTYTALNTLATCVGLGLCYPKKDYNILCSNRSGRSTSGGGKDWFQRVGSIKSFFLNKNACICLIKFFLWKLNISHCLLYLL